MIDAAFDSLVNQRLNLVLSSDRPLAVQHSALRLLRRLHDTPAVRVAADAPLDSTELIEHVNRIVAGLSIREATNTTTGVGRLAVLPVRVSAERAPDSIQLLVRLCRALPGSGLRLILIIEHPPALNACLAALGAAMFHWDIRPAAAAEEVSPAPPDAATSSTQREAPFVGTEPAREPAPPRKIEAPTASDHGAPASTASPPAITPTPGVLAKIIDSATNRPLRFALWVVGIPGLLIAGALAIGSALQPARAPTSVGAAQPGTASPSGQRVVGAKPANGTPKPEAATTGHLATVTTPASPSSSSVTSPSSAPPSPATGASPPVPAPAQSTAAAPAAAQTGPAGSSAAKPAGPPASAAALPAVPNPAQTTVPPGAAKGPTPPKTAAAPTALGAAAQPVAGPATPSGTTPPAATATAPADSPLPPAAAAQATAAGALPAATPATAFECTPATAPAPQAQPRNPSKDGGMVYLTSGRPVIVCVTDGTGALTRAEITPDQSRSFFGRAPWQVQASSLRDLQVFFQGARIPLPRNATDRLELIEQRLN